MSQALSEKEKRMLFWASFLSLAAAGFGFAFRVVKGGVYGDELQLTNLQVGMIFGASLWPIAITMILFSLVVDRTGYKIPMYVAFALQAISALGTAMGKSYGALYFAGLCAGLGHGIIEAVINPACAAVYPKEKTKWLTILHAAWPAGLVAGTLLIITFDKISGGAASWRLHACWILLPAIAYAIMYAPVKFPVDERVQAGVPFIDMLKEVGFLGAALASFMLIFEIGNQVAALTGWQQPAGWFTISLVAGIVAGGVFGAAVKSVGQPLFFLLCLLMVPIATAELGTDQWIGKLMTPVLTGMTVFGMAVHPAMGLVFSAAIMFIFRVFAGNILKYFTPPSLLALSGLLSAIGLLWLSSATGFAILVAFVCYALGQTYYWPCVLGFTSERYPRGGALTLNTVSAIGLLSVGIIGGQLLGAAFDDSIHRQVEKEVPALAAAAATPKSFLWESYKQIDPAKRAEYIKSLPAAEAAKASAAFTAIDNRAGRDVLKYAVQFPAILVLSFFGIWMYFRAKGGYKAVELTPTAAGGAPVPAGSGTGH